LKINFKYWKQLPFLQLVEEENSSIKHINLNLYIYRLLWNKKTINQLEDLFSDHQSQFQIKPYDIYIKKKKVLSLWIIPSSN
jgi:hypothetical protein